MARNTKEFIVNMLDDELNQKLVEQGFTERARTLVGEEIVKARLDELDQYAKAGNKVKDGYRSERKVALEKLNDTSTFPRQ